MEVRHYVALDVGQTRTGMASGSSAARLAEPLPAQPTDQIEHVLESLQKELNLAVIVVGLPRNASGDDTDQTKWVRQWTGELKTKIDVPFYFQDEFATTKVAADHVKSGQHLQADEDSVAAAIILQDFFNVPESQRLPA